jgi:Ala-tRNA(Pro) deacylase
MDDALSDPHAAILALVAGYPNTYRVIEHPAEGRSDEISRIRGNQLSQAAKAIVMAVRQNKKVLSYALVVVPGDCRVDFAAVARLGGGNQAAFAPMDKVQELTNCVSGAVPPFAFHPDLQLIVDPRLLKHDEIVFNAGRLDRSMFVQRETYLAVTNPRLADVAIPPDNDKTE